HPLQRCGVSISAYGELRRVGKTPPASAVWSFNFRLRRASQGREDTTRFSGVEFQFQPTASFAGSGRHHPLQRCGVSISAYGELRRVGKTPPASAVWSFNFSLQTAPLVLKLRTEHGG